MRRDDGAGVDRRRLRQAATDRGAFRVEGPRDDAEGRAHSVRADDQAADRYVTTSATSARTRVLCDGTGKPLTQKVIQVLVRRTARRANVKPGIHILRHTFCSHLAMRGAPARAIQELAGHQDRARRSVTCISVQQCSTQRFGYWRRGRKGLARPWRNNGGGNGPPSPLRGYGGQPSPVPA
jgi:hypothetical protein